MALKPSQQNLESPKSQISKIKKIQHSWCGKGEEEVTTRKFNSIQDRIFCCCKWRWTIICDIHWKCILNCIYSFEALTFMIYDMSTRNSKHTLRKWSVSCSCQAVLCYIISFNGSLLWSVNNGYLSHYNIIMQNYVYCVFFHLLVYASDRSKDQLKLSPRNSNMCHVWYPLHPLEWNSLWWLNSTCGAGGSLSCWNFPTQKFKLRFLQNNSPLCYPGFIVIKQVLHVGMSQSGWYTLVFQTAAQWDR